MSINAGRKILNEILNSDHRDLLQRIDQNPKAIGTLGLCGESPAHIAIYKNDYGMLKILLNAGINPNLLNSSGNSLVHVSAQLGLLDCLTLLYSTKKCVLHNKNKLGKTALDIAEREVIHSDLYITKFFAEYHISEASEESRIKLIVEGRKLCAGFLRNKMQYDREEKVKLMVKETTESMKERRNKARLIRGVSGSNYTSYYSDVSYPEKLVDATWEPSDLEFFREYHAGLDTVVRTVFACDYINNAIQVGYNNVLVTRHLST